MKKAKLGELGKLYRGVRQKNLSPNVKKLLNKSCVSLVGVSDVKDLLKEKELSRSEYWKNYKVLDKNGCPCISGYDIIFPTFPSKDVENDILYINEHRYKILIPMETMYIFRADDIPSAEYIYILLKSGIYEKFVKENDFGYKRRIIAKAILNIEIPMFDAIERRKICMEYDDIRKDYEELLKREKEFLNNLNKIKKQ